MYGINNIRKYSLTITCIIYLIYQLRLPFVIGESEWCLMEHTFSHNTYIVNFVSNRLVGDH